MSDDHTNPWIWVGMHQDKGITVPGYCVKTGQSEGYDLYVGHVRGHIGGSPVDTPCTIKYGVSADGDGIFFTFDGKVHNAFDRTFEAQEVSALRSTEENPKRVRKSRMDTKYKSAVELNCDYDPKCRKDRNLTCISRHLKWVSPKELESRKFLVDYKPVKAGLFHTYRDGPVALYIGRTSAKYTKPHLPGKVVLGKVTEEGQTKRMGKMWFGLRNHEFELQDPPHNESYEPSYEILVKCEASRCSIV